MSRVVLGVAGGIAAYKACELLRRLQADGHDVTVIPTAAALEFVGAATWAALSGKPVHTSVFDDVHEVPHVRLGQQADLVMVAPATADLLARAATGPEPVLVAPVIRRPDGRVWFDGADLYLADGATRASRKRPAGARTWPWLTGACLAFTKRTWELVGGFDDAFFLYWEDLDLSRRAVLAGVGLLVDAEAQVIHDPGGTQADAGGGKSTGYFYYNTRNRLIFGARHLEDADYRAWVRTSPRLALEILLRVGKRALLRSPTSAWAALRGTTAGLREGRRIRRAAQRTSVAP